jgi:hypothetical protein
MKRHVIITLFALANLLIVTAAQAAQSRDQIWSQKFEEAKAKWESDYGSISPEIYMNIQLISKHQEKLAYRIEFRKGVKGGKSLFAIGDVLQKEITSREYARIIGESPYFAMIEDRLLKKITPMGDMRDIFNKYIEWKDIALKNSVKNLQKKIGVVYVAASRDYDDEASVIMIIDDQGSPSLCIAHASEHRGRSMITFQSESVPKIIDATIKFEERLPIFLKSVDEQTDAELKKQQDTENLFK